MFCIQQMDLVWVSSSKRSALLTQKQANLFQGLNLASDVNGLPDLEPAPFAESRL